MKVVIIFSCLVIFAAAAAAVTKVIDVEVESNDVCKKPGEPVSHALNDDFVCLLKKIGLLFIFSAIKEKNAVPSNAFSMHTNVSLGRIWFCLK